MTKTLVIGVAFVGFVLTGCGSDGGGEGGSDLSGPQAAAVAATLEQAESGGLTLDEECVNGIASQLSEEDAEKIVADNDDDLSAEGEALGMELLGCADQDGLIDLFITGMAGSGAAFDEDCAREKLQDIDIAELVASSDGGDPPADVIAAIAECTESGG
ncbi:MAG TPA: hypothetical protein VES40_05720 [Ilumatobacteraceae bacterium]|nr:hypothetical protein [Ilumatobacteraceae bacterium]